ncbi:hypothetical protein BEWA_014260 [Theileria equi strain WA]|uniref:Crossover junction endonuclease MUS81 n=1 Tax=Theileria equi strain WA TaxID=1537102 RepID=L1LBQ8_THEEQ|nr:hypothetical protein BEWA_014260 [Theileria equi strain WA]EKX72867.1 hypothetical protein BEWA_014260 [Theileria equi strain WA]|eukprot:XP_004832319.1 hypothetical protein BEWA_014260 [Theileria equi strain WA]
MSRIFEKQGPYEENEDCKAFVESVLNRVKEFIVSNDLIKQPLEQADTCRYYRPIIYSNAWSFLIILGFFTTNNSPRNNEDNSELRLSLLDVSNIFVELNKNVPQCKLTNWIFLKTLTQKQVVDFQLPGQTEPSTKGYIFRNKDRYTYGLTKYGRKCVEPLISKFEYPLSVVRHSEFVTALATPSQRQNDETLNDIGKLRFDPSSLLSSNVGSLDDIDKLRYDPAVTRSEDYILDNILGFKTDSRSLLNSDRTIRGLMDLSSKSALTLDRFTDRNGELSSVNKLAVKENSPQGKEQEPFPRFSDDIKSVVDIDDSSLDGEKFIDDEDVSVDDEFFNLSPTSRRILTADNSQEFNHIRSLFSNVKSDPDIPLGNNEPDSKCGKDTGSNRSSVNKSVEFTTPNKRTSVNMNYSDSYADDDSYTLVKSQDIYLQPLRLRLKERLGIDVFEDQVKYEIITVVDKRELHDSDNKYHNKLMEVFQEADKRIIFKQLPLGDVIWIVNVIGNSAKEEFNDAYMLDWVLERKTTADLASSITDGRYDDQKLRLLNLDGFKRVIYLFEDSNISTLTGRMGALGQRGINSAAIASAKIHTQLITGFNIIHTKGMSHSAASLLLMHLNVEKLVNERIRMGRVLEECTEYTGIMQWLSERYTKFSEWESRNRRRVQMTYFEVFGKQLRSIPGCGAETTEAILSVWPTPYLFSQALHDMSFNEINTVLNEFRSKKRKRGKLTANVCLFYFHMH